MSISESLSLPLPQPRSIPTSAAPQFMLNMILLSRRHLTLRLRGLRIGPQYIYGPTIAGIPVCRVRGISAGGSVGKMSSKGAGASSREKVVRHPQSRAALKSFSERIERPSTFWTIFVSALLIFYRFWSCGTCYYSGLCVRLPGVFIYLNVTVTCTDMYHLMLH